jgi:hypothetical protein
LVKEYEIERKEKKEYELKDGDVDYSSQAIV